MNAVIPTVGDHMTPGPNVIAPDEKLARARNLMEEYGIRHLPVMRNGKLVGVLSERDLNLIQTLPHISPDDVSVEDAMALDPYVVSSDSPLHQVARVMEEHKLDSAIVVDHGKVIGVFTTTDALRALKEVLEGSEPRRWYESVTTAPRGGGRPLEHDIRVR